MIRAPRSKFEAGLSARRPVDKITNGIMITFKAIYDSILYVWLVKAVRGCLQMCA